MQGKTVDINPRMLCKVIVSYNVDEERIECVIMNLKSSKTIKDIMESVDGIISKKYNGFNLTKCKVLEGYAYEEIANPVADSNNELKFVVHVAQPLMARSQQKSGKIELTQEQIAEQEAKYAAEAQEQQKELERLTSNLKEFRKPQGRGGKPSTYGYKEVTRGFLMVSKFYIASAMLIKSGISCNVLPENWHADDYFGSYLAIPAASLALWGITNANTGKAFAKASTALMVCGVGASLYSGEVESLAIVAGLAVAVEVTGIVGANIISNGTLNYKALQDSFNDIKAGYYQGF